jgi:hypothetical protein
MENYLNPLLTELGTEETYKMVTSIADFTESEIFQKVRSYLESKGINPDEEYLGEIVSDISHYLYFQEIR